MTGVDPIPAVHLARKPFTSVSLTLELGVIVLPLLAMLVFVVPKFAQIFKDFHSGLPVATLVLLYISRCCANLYVAVGLLLVPLVVPILTTQLFWRPVPPRRSRKKRAILILVVLCEYALIIIGLFAPMIALIQTAGGPQQH